MLDIQLDRVQTLQIACKWKVQWSRGTMPLGGGERGSGDPGPGSYVCIYIYVCMYIYIYYIYIYLHAYICIYSIGGLWKWGLPKPACMFQGGKPAVVRSSWYKWPDLSQGWWSNWLNLQVQNGTPGGWIPYVETTHTKIHTYNHICHQVEL